MKKLKYLITVLLIFGITVLSLVGCGGKPLSVPTNFELDDNDMLTWDAVPSASSYTIEIKNVESGESVSRSTRKAKVSLVTLDEGDYEIAVKAVAGNTGNRDSQWSDPFAFHKDYVTGCIYTLINNNTEYEITKVGTASGVVLLEDEYRGLPVTSIAESAFRANARVTELVLGKNIESIGAYAFANCTSLTSITLPDSITEIGAYAFQYCRKLTNLVLPASLTAINEYTFSNCGALTQIEIGQKITSIGDHAFSGCTALEEIEIPDSVTQMGANTFSDDASLTEVKLSQALTEIPSYAFDKCYSLKTVEFGAESKLEVISSYAFRMCESLSEIVFPDGIKDIQSYSFLYCTQLENIVLPKNLEHLGVQAFTNTLDYQKQVDAEKEVYYIDTWLIFATTEAKDSLTEITETTFQEGLVGIADSVFVNAKFTSITFPSTLRHVGEQAFANNPRLWKLVIPDNSVEDLGTASFYNCQQLRQFVLGEGLKSLKPYTFMNCSLLETINLPNSLTEIGMGCFRGTALIEKADDYGVVYAGNWVVGYDEDTISSSIVLEADTVGIADYAFANCSTVRNITGTGIANVKYIGSGAFGYCTALASLSLNDNLSEIKSYTFYKCEALFSVTLPANLTKIGQSAFYQCSRLSSLNFSSTMLEEVGDYAFYGCTNVKTLNLGRRIQSIGYCAFYRCSAIESLTIPDTVTYLGDRAFYGCEGLTALTIGSGISELGAYVFGRCTSLEEVVIPANITVIGDYAFYRSTSLTKIVIGSNVTSIGNFAFYGSSALKQITLPQSVTSIGRYAFRACTSLSSVTIGTALEKIGMHAFQGCSVLTVYTEAEESSDGWNNKWNSSYRPVIWGCTLSEDGEYVVSVTIGENTIENSHATRGISDPYREGYRFEGWSTSPNGTSEYSVENLAELEEGTTVYAVWTASAEDEEVEDEI